MNSKSNWRLYLNANDWTWWVWMSIALLLSLGLAGVPRAFAAALVLCAGQTVYFIARERSLLAFPAQLRIAYLLLLLVCHIPALRWLYWLPAVGTWALVVFGYCLLARFLSLLPWNSSEPYSMDRLRRTFLSPPDLSRVDNPSPSHGCAGGLCTIRAQVAPAAASRAEGERTDSFTGAARS